MSHSWSGTGWRRPGAGRPAGRQLSLEPLESRLVLSTVQFAPPAPVSGYDAPDEARAVDLDGDGDLDILTASSANWPKVAWYENTNGVGSFSRRRVITEFAAGPGSVEAADLDGDGDNDVLYASRWGDRVAWHENLDGEGSFSTQHVVSNGVDEALSVAAADLDADGDLS